MCQRGVVVTRAGVIQQLNDERCVFGLWVVGDGRASCPTSSCNLADVKGVGLTWWGCADRVVGAIVRIVDRAADAFLEHRWRDIRLCYTMWVCVVSLDGVCGCVIVGWACWVGCV